MGTNPTNFQKQPYDQFTINFDFTKKLTTTGGNLVAHTVLGVNNSTGNDVTSEIIGGSAISSDAQSINVGVKGGEDDQNYLITVRARTDVHLPDGTSYEEFEGEVLMIVNDLP